MFLIFILGILVLIGGIIAGFCMKNHGWSAAGAVVCVILVIVSCISSVPTGYTGILTPLVFEKKFRWRPPNVSY